MSLCPEYEFRKSLSDGDFWAHIFKMDCAPDYSIFDGPDLDEPSNLAQPCPVCGELNACGYDSEGRSMIHSINEREEDE